MNRFIISGLTVFFFAIILPFTGCKKSEGEKTDQQVKGVEVSVGTPVRTRLVESITLNGNTLYQKQEIIRGTFSGYIEKLLRNVGDRVKAGDVLFLVKTKEADAVGKNTPLSANDSFSGLVKITARSEGVLIEVDHQSGDYIAEGEQLAVIVDPASLRIALEVPYEYAGKVSPSGSYSIQLPDGRESTIHAGKQVPSMDPANQTQRYIFEPAARLELPANLNVGIKIPLRLSAAALALPNSALMTDETQSEFWVMKLINDSTAVKQIVKKGIESDSLVEILDPQFSLSDRFVVEGAFGLPDSASIAIQGKEK
jgi:biotin carboxyl carrier protein